ncbi:MAG: glycosyltransferase [Chitinophagales bacterium]|jgi:glycosyltransferase involved in cell wall biosynthesis|nr:glycosyltransferase [Chitinophagales bacterium]
MSKQVLYISYDGMTDPLGQSQVIPYLIGLSNKGFKITLISCEKRENSAAKSKIETLLNSHHICWEPLLYTKKPPILSTIYDIIRIKRLALRLHQKNNFNIVHCRSYIAALVGLKLKKEQKIKFIFDMRGFWADERVDGKLWNLKNPLYKIVYNYFKRKEVAFLESADYTISLTNNAKQEILSWQNIHNNPIKIQVIPCCADLNLFNKSTINLNKKDQLKISLNINNGDFVLLYLGSIGTWYMLHEMMEFFSVLKQKIPAAKFLFVTKEEHGRILETAERFNVKDSIIIRPGNREEIPYLISLCNFSIFFILPAYSKKASSPTKQGELMAMGIPIICNTNVGDTDKIVNDYNSGILIADFNKQSYLSAIDNMQIKFDEASIVDGAFDYFSLENGVEKYAAVYASVLN